MPTFHLLKCKCGTELQVSPRQAGTVVDCKKCGSNVEVPSLGTLRRETTAKIEDDRFSARDWLQETKADFEYSLRRNLFLKPVVSVCLFSILLAGFAPWFCLNIEHYPELLKYGLTPVELLVLSQVIGLIAALVFLKISSDVVAISIVGTSGDSSNRHSALWLVFGTYVSGLAVAAFCYFSQ